MRQSSLRNTSPLPPLNISDLSVFHLADEQHCDTQCTDFKDCLHCIRIFSCLELYSLSNVKDDKNDTNIFEDFIENIYPLKCLLHDYHHFIKTHSSCLEEIKAYLTKEKAIELCSAVEQCEYSSRHHRVNTDDDLKSDNDDRFGSTFNLYCTILDGLHFYVFHLYHIGIRASNTYELHQSDGKIEEEVNNFFDEEFGKIRELIFSRRHKTLSVERFPSTENNAVSKFNINMNNNNDCIENNNSVNDDEGVTYLEAVYQNLTQRNVDSTVLEKLKKYIQDEEYCTEALDYDINYDDGFSGNISNCIADNKCIKYIMDFIKGSRRMFYMFILLYSN